MVESFFNSLRQIVATDDALEDVVTQLGSFLAGGERSLRNEVIGLSSQIAQWSRRRRRGERSAEELSAERSTLRGNVLALIDELERLSVRSSLPVPQVAVLSIRPESGTLEKIIGDDRLKSVAWLRRGLAAARSVCRITAPGGRASGFLVMENFIVTAEHVLSSRDDAASAIVEFNFEEDSDGTLLTPVKYRLDAATWVSDASLDCAMVRVLDTSDAASTPKLSSWGHLRWGKAGHDPVVGEYVSIIQHPAGGPKKVAVSENQITSIYEHRLQYTTDTLNGSSGSPVFNDDWEVIAVHHGGGNLVTNQKGDKRYINEGTLCAHLRRAFGIA